MIGAMRKNGVAKKSAVRLRLRLRLKLKLKLNVKRIGAMMHSVGMRNAGNIKTAAIPHKAFPISSRDRPKIPSTQRSAQPSQAA